MTVFEIVARRNVDNWMNLQLTTVFLIRLFQTCIIVKRTCISNFSKTVLADQSKRADKCICKKLQNLQLEFSKMTPSRHALPLTLYDPGGGL